MNVQSKNEDLKPSMENENLKVTRNRKSKNEIYRARLKIGKWYSGKG